MTRPAEDLGVGKNLDGQGVRLPAFAKLALDERERATIGRFIDIDAGTDVDKCLVAFCL